METHDECADEEDFIPLDLAETRRRDGLKVSGIDAFPGENVEEVCNVGHSKYCATMCDNWHVQYDFVKPILFRGYGVKSANDRPDRNPKKWELSFVEVNVHTGEDLNDSEWLNFPQETDQFLGFFLEKKFMLDKPYWTKQIKLLITELIIAEASTQ